MSIIYPFSPGTPIEIKFPKDKFDKYLSMLKIKTKDSFLVNAELIFAMSFKDFKTGANSLDEFSEISNYIFGQIDKDKAPLDFVDALISAYELNFYIRNVRDLKDSSVPDFMTRVENYFKIIRPTLLDKLKEYKYI